MRRINRCLNPRLVEICKRTVQLEDLNSKLADYLPSNLKEHCYVGSFNQGCLALVVNDSIWASELRYSIPALRDKLRKEAGIYQLTSIKVMVSTTESPRINRSLTTRGLSEKSREAIQSGGDQCRYEPLRAALYQLARIKDKKTNQGVDCQEL